MSAEASRIRRVCILHGQSLVEEVRRVPSGARGGAVDILVCPERSDHQDHVVQRWGVVIEADGFERLVAAGSVDATLIDPTQLDPDAMAHLARSRRSGQIAVPRSEAPAY